MPVKVRAAVLQALLELRVHLEGLDAGINLALELIETDLSFRGTNSMCIFPPLIVISLLCKSNFSECYISFPEFGMLYLCSANQTFRIHIKCSNLDGRCNTVG